MTEGGCKLKCMKRPKKRQTKDEVRHSDKRQIQMKEGSGEKKTLKVKEKTKYEKRERK